MCSSKPKCGSDFLSALVPIIDITYSLLFTLRHRNSASARVIFPVTDYNVIAVQLFCTTEGVHSKLVSMAFCSGAVLLQLFVVIPVVKSKLKLSVNSTALATAQCVGPRVRPVPWNLWVPSGSPRLWTSVCGPGNLPTPQSDELMSCGGDWASPQGVPPAQPAVQSSPSRGSSWVPEGAPRSYGGRCCCTLSTLPASRWEALLLCFFARGGPPRHANYLKVVYFEIQICCGALNISMKITH